MAELELIKTELARRDAAAFSELSDLLLPGQLARLAELLQEIACEPGYGTLSLVIVGGQVKQFNAEKTYKSNLGLYAR